MASEAEKNFVHEDENWRQRVRYESESQKIFGDTWGFLSSSGEREQVKYDRRLVKYFNPAGGTWTVKEKRVPERGEASTTDDEVVYEKSALAACAATHSTRMDNMPENVGFMTTNLKYGERKTLEQFGICQHARVKTRSKEPSN